MSARSVVSRRHPRGVAFATLGLTAAIALSACSGKSSSPAAAGSATGSTVAKADPHTANVTITNAKCVADQASYASGGLTFNVKNTDATAVSEIELLQGERIIGEKENLPPGFSGSFSLSVQPGTYTLYCPGATTERVPLTVTGTAVTTSAGTTHDLLIAGTKTYGQYVSSQIALLLTGVQTLSTALAQPETPASLAAAQAAYGKSRVFYERIEPVAESFTIASGSLDAAIDSRADDVPVTKLTGFHRIEYGLFTKKSLAGLPAFGTELVGDVTKLQTLAKGLTYQPAELANGAVELLDEVQKSKITGEEERYSHIDLLDFSGNVEGSEQAFANLQPGLKQIDATLTATVTARFADLENLLDKYRSAAQPSGFVLYATLTTADKQALSRSVQAVAEPLSKVAGKVVNS
jgi:iron uptake system component EfeO